MKFYPTISTFKGLLSWKFKILRACLLAITLVASIIFYASTQELGVTSQDEAFPDRFLPIPLNSGFQILGYTVWYGSVIRGEDGRYYMFASRWPTGKGYSWGLDSEVVLASLDNPVGPYKFEDVVLPKRGTRYWYEICTHNPTIHKYKGTYLLYYTGTTYTDRNYNIAWAQTYRSGYGNIHKRTTEKAGCPYSGTKTWQMGQSDHIQCCSMRDARRQSSSCI